MLKFLEMEVTSRQSTTQFENRKKKKKKKTEINFGDAAREGKVSHQQVYQVSLLWLEPFDNVPFIERSRGMSGEREREREERREEKRREEKKREEKRREEKRREEKRERMGGGGGKPKMIQRPEESLT